MGSVMLQMKLSGLSPTPDTGNQPRLRSEHEDEEQSQPKPAS
jgi:hypothetical protein